EILCIFAAVEGAEHDDKLAVVFDDVDVDKAFIGEGLTGLFGFWAGREFGDSNTENQIRATEVFVDAEGGVTGAAKFGEEGIGFVTGGESGQDYAVIAGSFPADFGGGETVGNKIVAESVGHALLEIAGDYDEGSGCASCGRGGSLATSEVNGGGAFSTCLAAGGAGRQQRKAPENHYTEKEASYSAH